VIKIGRSLGSKGILSNAEVRCRLLHGSSNLTTSEATRGTQLSCAEWDCSREAMDDDLENVARRSSTRRRRREMKEVTSGDEFGASEITLNADRLVLPITEVTGNIWVLDGVDR
jgi:hypothetical protein